jgi:hypothetical protein
MGLLSVVSILIVVVLPAPLGPSSPNTSPDSAAIVWLSTVIRLSNRRVRA